MPKSVFSERYERLRRMLIDARKEAGVTQLELAERLGWRQADVSKAERGERRLDVVEFLDFADAIGFDAAEFVARLLEQ